MMSTRNNRDGLLAPDDRILWQGQPRSTIDRSGLFSPLTFLGAVFAGFSMFWTAMAVSMTAGRDLREEKA